MPPTLHIVRHAEGFHNSSKGGEGIHDPLLTEKGQEQCRKLCKDFPHHDKIELLMASPMKRTIQTCKISFAPVVERGQRILLMPLAQESSDEPMDTGSTDEEITKEFGDLVDFHRLKDFPYWNRNVGQFDTTPEARIERARKLRAEIRARPEKEIALVTHGSFAHSITGNMTMEGEETTRMWQNAECRTFTFNEEDEYAQLIETEESKQRRPDIQKRDSGYLVSTDGKRRNSAGDLHNAEGGSP